MPTFTVKNAVSTSKPDKGYGPKQAIALTLQEYGQAEEIAAEWYTNATTPVPATGSQIEGDVAPSQFGMKFTKAKTGGFTAGAPRGRSPEENRRIVRQHSQHMALMYAQLRLEDGDLPPHFSFDQLKAAIDFFHRDAMDGGQ